MTGVVQADLVGECTQWMVHLDYIMQKLHHIHNLTRSHTLVLAFQQTGIVQLDKSRTTDGWGYDIVVTLKFVFKLLCQGDGLLLETGIGHRLTTTGLVQGIVHVQSQMSQKLVCGDAYLRVHHVNITGDK